MILLKPYLECNLKCEYCYQIGKKNNYYNVDKVLETLDKIYSGKEQIVLHGGECLCMGHEDVEIFLKKSYEKSGASGIQTNGILVDDRYIEIFKKYKTTVGISLDGPYPLNRLRTNEDITNKILENLDNLILNGVECTVIITLNKENGGNSEVLNKLKNFILQMDHKKISGRINPTYYPGRLSGEEAKKSYIELARFMLEHGLVKKWSPFKDIISKLKGLNRSVCIYEKCDPFSTPSAKVILGDGTLSICTRGRILVRHPQIFEKREEILMKVPKEYGGCKNCRYFDKCYGGCPGCADDWRQRDVFCDAHYGLFEYFENILTSVDIPVEYSNSNLSNPKEKRNFISDHTDGIEHIDGHTIHLDSDIKMNPIYGHTDGIEHVDGYTTHLDSDIK